jgi:hypothetical protein
MGELVGFIHMLKFIQLNIQTVEEVAISSRLLAILSKMSTTGGL